MSYYRECPICGSNLDPGEQCTCVEDRRKEAERKHQILQIGGSHETRQHHREAGSNRNQPVLFLFGSVFRIPVGGFISLCGERIQSLWRRVSAHCGSV